MMQSSPQVYLITGANRGLGLGLVKAVLSAQHPAFVYAAVRAPDSADVGALNALVQSHPGGLEIVQCVSGDEEGNRVRAEIIREQNGRVDVVIANAGISNWFGRVEATPIHQLTEHFKVNAAGIVVFFQAVYTLLKGSASPKFIPISTQTTSTVLTLDRHVSAIFLRWILIDYYLTPTTTA